MEEDGNLPVSTAGNENRSISAGEEPSNKQGAERRNPRAEGEHTLVPAPAGSSQPSLPSYPWGSQQGMLRDDMQEDVTVFP